MITLTTELKSRRFKEEEKRYLYRKLTDPLKDERDKIRDSFISFLEKNILEKFLDPDLLELGRKPYCINYSNYFCIYPGAFGLDKYYIGSQEFKDNKVGLYFEFYSKEFNIALPKKSISNRYDITNITVKNGDESVKDQVKYFLYEYAKKCYDCMYFGLGTFIMSERHYNYFHDINTWGGLYKADPKIFKLLYERYYSESGTEKDIIDPEKKLLRDLKVSLGY